MGADADSRPWPCEYAMAARLAPTADPQPVRPAECEAQGQSREVDEDDWIVEPSEAEHGWNHYQSGKGATDEDAHDVEGK